MMGANFTPIRSKQTLPRLGHAMCSPTPTQSICWSIGRSAGGLHDRHARRRFFMKIEEMFPLAEVRHSQNKSRAGFVLIFVVTVTEQMPDVKMSYDVIST